MDPFAGVRVVFFDFGDTLGRLRAPFHWIPRLRSNPDPAEPRPVTVPGPFRRLLRQVFYPLLARLWRPFPDTAPVLDELRVRGYRLAVLSNNSPIIEHQLRALGIADRFEAVTSSEEAGVAKPDPRIFALACERMGVVPGAAVHVGDRLRADALASRSAGLRPVLLDPAGHHPDAGVITVASLPGLFDILPTEPAP
jgi:HAD superfamily hydrolase (TIGR01509 family)